MVSWVNDVIDRLVALEKEAMQDVFGRAYDAYPYFFVSPEKAPYITNRLQSLPIEDDGSEVEDVQSPVFIIRFHAGNVTSGIKGEREREMYELIPYLAEYINARELLQSDTYPTRPNDIFRARCFDAGGFRIFPDTGIGTAQYGFEQQIRVDRDERLLQVYN